MTPITLTRWLSVSKIQQLALGSLSTGKHSYSNLWMAMQGLYFITNKMVSYNSKRVISFKGSETDSEDSWFKKWVQTQAQVQPTCPYQPCKPTQGGTPPLWWLEMDFPSRLFQPSKWTQTAANTTKSQSLLYKESGPQEGTSQITAKISSSPHHLKRRESWI